MSVLGFGFWKIHFPKKCDLYSVARYGNLRGSCFRCSSFGAFLNSPATGVLYRRGLFLGSGNLAAGQKETFARSSAAR